jgi:hypothetical protein
MIAEIKRQLSRSLGQRRKYWTSEITTFVDGTDGRSDPHTTLDVLELDLELIQQDSLYEEERHHNLGPRFLEQTVVLYAVDPQAYLR